MTPGSFLEERRHESLVSSSTQATSLARSSQWTRASLEQAMRVTAKSGDALFARQILAV